MAIGQLRRKQRQLADREHKCEMDLEKVSNVPHTFGCSWHDSLDLALLIRCRNLMLWVWVVVIVVV